MTDEMSPNLRAGRMQVSRSRGAVGGSLLVLGGLWAGLVPFVGPYANLAYTPSVNSAWKWTAARGWLEVLPGGVALLGGLLLIMSTNRVVASLGGWLGVAAGGWLVVGPVLADPLGLDLGTPDPNQTSGIRAIEAITFFFGIGAGIVLVAGLALGRLSVHSVRDVQFAERRAAAEAELVAEEQRRADERAEYEQAVAAQQAERERAAAENAERDRQARENAERAAAADQADRERAAAAERADRERTEQAERERADRERVAAAEQAERERATAEQAERERATAEQAERERATAEQAERERATAEHERAAAEQAERERTAAAQSEPAPVQASDEGHEPAHAAPSTPSQPTRGDYPPFYGNRSS